jgi:hypothetical protein
MNPSPCSRLQSEASHIKVTKFHTGNVLYPSGGRVAARTAQGVNPSERESGQTYLLCSCLEGRIHMREQTLYGRVSDT